MHGEGRLLTPPAKDVALARKPGEEVLTASSPVGFHGGCAEGDQLEAWDSANPSFAGDRHSSPAAHGRAPTSTSCISCLYFHFNKFCLYRPLGSIPSNFRTTNKNFWAITLFMSDSLDYNPGQVSPFLTACKNVRPTHSFLAHVPKHMGLHGMSFKHYSGLHFKQPLIICF